MAGGPRLNILRSQHSHVCRVCGEMLRSSVSFWYTDLQYTVKARWSEFKVAMDAALNEWAMTVEKMKSVGSCDQLDELEELKRDARTKKGCIRNAAPNRREYAIGEYVEAKQAYERTVAETQTAGLKQFCSAQDGESLWDGICRVIRETGKTGRISYFNPIWDKY
ncbi:hypothetical protein EVAR_81258_1 [Eumeta japonica]|uniref:Uncharacterized protein n=1 Tax=Eumeta variegata TaxID=151549 RepID=A0A4C1WTB9_EUMVA|nr:hypothetical protein EVAR_81258_1 [Eumeta japonica]